MLVSNVYVQPASSLKKNRMENIIIMNDQIRLNLLEKCFNLGLPASSKDDINTLKMYLDVDSKLDPDIYNFIDPKVIKRKAGIKFLFHKMFSND